MSRRSDIKKSNIGCSPTLVQNTIHYLSSEQIALLNRGPTYVPPCQMHISSFSSSSESLDQTLTKQMAPLRRQLTRIFTRYPVDLSRRMKFEQEIQTLFKNSFSLPIPSSLEKRACYEKELIQSTRRQLKHDRLILRRTADDQNTYYLGSVGDFNFKANEYIQNSNCYEIIGVIDDNNNTEQQQLHEIIRSIDLNLELLQERKLIPKEHVMKLNIDSKRSTIKLPYLYFLPETHQDGSIVSLQPRISSCHHCPVQILATYLDQLLRPLFEHISRSTTFLNGADFMKKLECYCNQQDSLRSETCFITFEIQNLYTHLLHTDILTGVSRLLVHPLNQGRRPDRLTSDGLEELTGIFLRNNIFTYNGKIYRHVKGIPLNFPLSRLLFNIYLHHWQYTLLRPVRIANEFFGLYYNTGFLTWNQSVDRIQTIFNEINQAFLPATNIQLKTISMSTQVNFLNVYIKHRLGLLFTRVYHDPTQQSFLLPYVTGHPRLVHRQWFRFALIRAALYCLYLEDFQDEQLYIELTFLANGYSLDFIEYHIRQFFRLVRPQELDVQLDRHRYNAIRTYCFRLIDQQKRALDQQQQLEINRQFIQIPYLFDWGTRWKFNREFYKLWYDILEQDSTFRKHGLKIKLHSKHCYSSNVLLTH